MNYYLLKESCTNSIYVGVIETDLDLQGIKEYIGEAMEIWYEQDEEYADEILERLVTKNGFDFGFYDVEDMKEELEKGYAIVEW